MNMTQQELRELEAWIAENVMKWKRVSGLAVRILDDEFFVDSNGCIGRFSCAWIPTTDPAAAMMVLEKCCESMAVNVEIWKAGNGEWVCRMVVGSGFNSTNQIGVANTLPLAICLFAKKLFTK